MKKTANIRTTRTAKAIHNAFVEMICEKKPEEINVKALTERAGIHRKTFYLHYTCIEALFEDELNRLSNEYFAEVAKLPVPFNYFDLTRIFFHFASKTEYAELLYCNPKYSEFSSKLMITTMKHNREINNPYAEYSPEMQNIINAFVVNASMAAFRQWVSDHKTVPMEHVIEVIGKLLENGVSSITNRHQIIKPQHPDSKLYP